MPFVQLRDLKLYYETAGSGPKLLHISGTGGDLRRKPSAIDSPLAGRFTVLSHDQRGLGRTDKPDRPYTMADYADDAAGLLDAVGWDRARVLGVSFGGMVALQLALRHPARVERLALACTAPGGAGGSSYPLHELSALPPAEAARLHFSAQDRRHSLEWQDAHPDTARALIADAVKRRGPVDPSDPLILMGMQRQLEARAAHDVYDRLGELAMPVGIFAGRHDGQAPELAQHAMMGRIKGATLQFFEGGHGFLAEDPKAYPAVAAFLA